MPYEKKKLNFRFLHFLQVLYNWFLDCLVALPIAARQQIVVVILLLCRCFSKCLIASLTTG
ncbi:unnamed protein product [Prunus brigantina]